jgi:hypothetical protein
MSSPFRYFRKHTKAFMAVAAVMCMFLFVFASGTGGGGGSQDNQRQASAVVATWDGGRINEGELATLVQQRLITDEFLRMVFAQGGGQTGYDLPINIPALFLASRDSAQLDLTAVENELFSSLATDAGMSISSEMINRYISEIGLRRVDSDDVLGILANLGDGNVQANEAIVFSTLRKLLLAYFYSQSYADAGFVVLPEQRWEDWRRVNERISLQVATLPVESFLDKVPEPTDAQLTALFEQHRDAIPNRFASVGGRELPMADPGFAEPRRVQLQYLVGSVAERTEQLLATVTEEEIADYYERNKRLEYVKEDDPLSGLDFDNDEPFDPTAEPGAETPTDEPAAGEEPAADERLSDELGDPAAGEESAEPTDELNPETPTESGDAAEAPAGEAPVEEPASEATVDEAGEPAQPADDAASSGDDEPAAEGEAAPGEADQSSLTSRRSPFRLTALQVQADAPTEGDAAAAQGEGSEDASDTAADAAVAEEASDDAEEAVTDELSPEGAAEDDAAGTEKPADGAGATADAEEEDKPVEYIPLDEVKDEIRRAIAREKAVDELRQKIGEAAAKLQTEYNQYGRKLIEARELEQKEPEVPARLKDLSWLAEESGLKLQTTEPLTDRELFETAVGKAVDEQSNRISVTQATFLTLELHEPYLAKELEGDWYLVTKVADTPRRVPEFSEVRDQVAAAWKRIEAAKLAQKQAEDLAKEVGTAAESFDEFFKAKGFETIPQTAMFSWRTFPLGPGMGAPAELSDVPELKNIGPEFMEAAFRLDGTATKAVMNYDRSAAYVIRLHSRQYTTEELRKLFLAEDNTWPGRLDMLQEHQAGFRQMVNRRLWEEFANFKFDEEWEQRREERLAERN